MSTHQQFVDGISAYEHELYKLPEFPGDYTEPDQPMPKLVEDVNEADVISSRVKGEPYKHTIMLDLDVPATLVPSTTEGHSHLYIDVELDQAAYVKLLKALRDAGVIEPGFAAQIGRRGYTSLRLPWIKKVLTAKEAA